MLCILILVAYICYGKMLSSSILCCSVFYTHPFFKKLLLRSFRCLSNKRNHLALVLLANVNTSKFWLGLCSLNALVHQDFFLPHDAHHILKRFIELLHLFLKLAKAIGHSLSNNVCRKYLFLCQFWPLHLLLSLDLLALALQ